MINFSHDRMSPDGDLNPEFRNAKPECYPLHRIIFVNSDLLLSNIEVKNVWSYTSTPPYVFTEQCFN
jgi:hypothetical protein